MAAGRGDGRGWTAWRSAPRASKVQAVRRRRMVAEPRDRSLNAGAIHLHDQQLSAAGLRGDAHGRRPSGACPRLDREAQGEWVGTRNDCDHQDDTERDLHHCPERPGGVPSPVSRSEDADRAARDSYHRDTGAVRSDLPVSADASSQLLVETNIECGLRWGELSELRPRDLVVRTRTLTVSRAVVYVNPQFHPEGGRFLIKQYPKDEEPRRFRLSPQIVNKLNAHIETGGLEPNDLLFPMRQDEAARPRKARLVGDRDALGLTEPNAAGRRYRHATLTGYSLGRCRCEHCKDAYAVYRAERREAGKDDPRTPRLCDTDGHIPRAWFRRNVWLPALAAAHIGLKVRVHDLRHAHASWLLAGGADLQVVKERLGHGSIRTTERYLHTLPDSDETALDALTKIRGRSAT